MIQINLLDQSSGRRKKNAGPAAAAASGPGGGMGRSSRSGGGGSALIVVVSVLMLALNGVVGYLVYQTWNTSYVKYTEAKTKRDGVKTEIAKKLNDAEQIRRYREIVNNQMDVLKTLDPPDRILWSEKLNMLANLAPAGVFLSDIEITEKVTMVETKASIAAREKWEKAEAAKRGPQPEKVNKPVISYLMRITGLGLGRDNVEQFNNALNFHEAMIKYSMVDDKGRKHAFMDGFNTNVDFESVEATTYETEAVNKFIFKLTTVPVGEDTNLDQPKDANGKPTVMASAAPAK